MTRSVILDFYDDPSGSVLKGVLPGENIPEFVKQAEYIYNRAVVGDDSYALVVTDGDNKLRKFACTDKGNTALSAIYFLETRDRLPPSMQKVAASKIVEACRNFGLSVPSELHKIASGTVSGFSMGVGGGVYKKASVFSYALSGDLEKAASVGGTEGPRFPLDTYGDVSNSVEWFEKFASSLHPSERREYCLNSVFRASELGIPVTHSMRKYASTSYAPDHEVKIAVETRKQFWRDGSSERSLLDSLLEKKASVEPDVFCEALHQFDVEHGMNHYWDSEVQDPWFSTYGVEKIAEWEFSEQGDRVTAGQLKQLSRASYPLISIKFGEDVAKDFSKDPVTIFESLPLDSKKILMRMANDDQPSSTLV